MKCGICGRTWPEDKCKVITLSAEERAYVLSTTHEEAPEQYIYCKPCWKVATDRTQGLQLMSGIIQATMRNAGNPNAEKAAQKFHDFLISKAGKPVS